MALRTRSRGFSVDGTLYPDRNPPQGSLDLDEKVDFLSRLCSAWDFGLLPRAEVITEIRRKAWREAVRACLLPTSPAYHLLREWHGLPRLSYLGQRLAYIADDPNLRYV